MLGSPSVAEGMVFASSNMRTFYGINAATGGIIWNFTDPSATEFLVSAPIYVNGELWIIDKYSITAVNASTGQTIRSFFTGDELYVSPSTLKAKSMSSLASVTSSFLTLQAAIN